MTPPFVLPRARCRRQVALRDVGRAAAICLCAAFAAAGGDAFGADGDDAEADDAATSPPAAKDMFFFSPVVSGEWRPETAYAGGRGRVASATAAGEFSMFLKRGGHTLYAETAWRRTDWHFEIVAAGVTTAAGALPDYTQRAGALVHYEWQYSPRWGVVAMLTGNGATGDGARFGDALSGAVGVGMRYNLPKEWVRGLTFFSGVMLASRIQTSPDWLPFAALNWKIDKHWSLRTGAGLTLTHDFFGDESLRVSLAGAWHNSRFLLRSDTTGGTGVGVAGAAGAKRDRVLQTKEALLTLSVTKEFLKRFGYIRAGVGGSFFGKHKFRSHSERLETLRVHPHAVLTLEGGIRF
ncbi:MAG: hypothetical protein LBR07_07995 [Puniceicoccales bacterium]|jgi:hypothetical protein|nr:hypothetical protein [Puniceicoccales bacterium]